MKHYLALQYFILLFIATLQIANSQITNDMQSGVRFIPPVGWLEMTPEKLKIYRDSNTIAGWMLPSKTPKNFPQNINIQRSTAQNMKIDEFTKSSLDNLKKLNTSVLIEKPQQNPNCPKNSRIIGYTMNFVGLALKDNVVITITNKTSYTGTYSREASEKPDPKALDALRTLCPGAKA